MKWGVTIARASGRALRRGRSGRRRCGLLRGFVQWIEAGEMALGVERGHAAHAGRGHRLAVDFVGDVAGREHAGDDWSPSSAVPSRCSRTASSRAAPLNNSVCGTWPMAMKIRPRNVERVAGERAPEPRPGDAEGILVPSTSASSVFHIDVDLRIGEQALLQDLLGAQHATAMHERHPRGDIGEVHRLLDGGIAAADHDHLLAAEEEAVAGGAGRDAKALEVLLRRQAEPAGLRAGGDDEGVGSVFRSTRRPSARRAALQIDGVDMVVRRSRCRHGAPAAASAP